MFAKRKKEPDMVTDKFAWELQRISMAGSKMFLCVVDWEGFIKVKIQKCPKIFI